MDDTTGYRYGWNDGVMDLSANHRRRITELICADATEGFISARALAGELNVTKTELEDKRVFINNCTNPAFTILSLWHDKSPEVATIRVLQVALESIEREDVLVLLREAMLDSFVFPAVVNVASRGHETVLRCKVVGMSQSVRDVLDPYLLELELTSEHMDIVRPAGVTWHTAAHLLKAQQLDLSFQSHVDECSFTKDDRPVHFINELPTERSRIRLRSFSIDSSMPTSAPSSFDAHKKQIYPNINEGVLLTLSNAPEINLIEDAVFLCEHNRNTALQPAEKKHCNLSRSISNGSTPIEPAHIQFGQNEISQWSAGDRSVGCFYKKTSVWQRSLRRALTLLGMTFFITLLFVTTS